MFENTFLLVIFLSSLFTERGRGSQNSQLRKKHVPIPKFLQKCRILASVLRMEKERFSWIFFLLALFRQYLSIALKTRLKSYVQTYPTSTSIMTPSGFQISNTHNSCLGPPYLPQLPRPPPYRPLHPSPRLPS